MSDLLELKDRTLIDMLLEEQGQVDTPVGRFAEEAEAAQGSGAAYRDLIPLSAPQQGEQYGFEVNLDKCSGCKGCVTACHSLNGLDDGETWREVGLLVGGSELHPFQQSVTTACHHCVDPACLNGCPVNAYEKDPVSGIVMHLDDQCIGCQYCVLKCPYDVPKYSAKRGIVRKCDMCHSRLSEGEAPACVQACPHEAIRIVTVETESAREAAQRPERFLPDSPDPSYTVPTTRFVSKNGLPENLQAADARALRPQATHGPLVAMLSLTQVGVGGFALVALFGGTLSAVEATLATAASWLLFHLGLAASALHLGQPLKAWRIFLGFRRSWLSREALVFGLCSLLANGALVSMAARLWLEGAPLWVSDLTRLPFLEATAAVGLLGALTSVFIYVDTQRSFWNFRLSAGKFFGSVAMGYFALGLACFSGHGAGWGWWLGLAATGLAKLALERSSWGENEATARLVDGPLGRIWRWRRGVALAALFGAPALCLAYPGALSGAVLLAGVVAGEALERVLYFKAVNAPKMPGAITT